MPLTWMMPVLASEFGVAIGTVRKAVDSLVADQVLVRRQGKGTFVTAHDGSRLMFYFFHIVGRDDRVQPVEVQCAGHDVLR